MHNTPTKTTLPERITSRELAEFIGITASRLSGLVREGKIQPPNRDGYLLAETVRDYITSLRRAHHDGSLIATRQRKLLAEARLAEIQVAEAEKRLVPAKNVERVWNQACIGLRQVILAADVSMHTKEELTRQLREIPIDDFLDEPADADAPIT